MKQFIICLGFTLLLYYISACLNGAYDPMEWGFGEGNMILGFLFIVIWIAPIMLNYLNGDKNFE